MNKANRRKRRLPKILIIILLVVILAGVGVGVYAYRNMNYDNEYARMIEKAGVIEKQVTLPDGSVINYGESAGGGIPLLLIHGQMVSWEDYAKVLPSLSEQFHIYAVDCYGHGGSSKTPEKYSAVANGTDLIWFIENVIKAPVIVSGHSSGGLIATWIAANSPENVRGLVIEDSPFFATEPRRAEQTYAWLGFESIHNFLNSDEQNFTAYSLQHNYMQTMFGEDGWNKIVLEPALKYMDKHPGQIPRIWLYPRTLGINSIYDLTANMQDGTGDYDLRFGETFYDFSWFDGFNQEETLKMVECPSVLLHVAPPKNMDGYYDSNGILFSAMDGEDASRVDQLLTDNVFIENVQGSNHDIHMDVPKVFIDALNDFLIRNP